MEVPRRVFVCSCGRGAVRLFALYGTYACKPCHSRSGSRPTSAPPRAITRTAPSSVLCPAVAAAQRSGVETL
jgi:hypothetical protein